MVNSGLGNNPEKKSVDRRQEKGPGQEQTRASRFAKDNSHQFFKAIDRGAAELVGLAACFRVVQHARNRRRHIADIDGLKLRMPAADQRQDRQIPRQPGKFVEEFVFRTEYQRGAQDRGIGKLFTNPDFAAPFGFGVSGIGVAIGADRREVNQCFYARLACQTCDARSRIDMYGLEAVLAAAVENAGEIDDRIGFGNGGRNGFLVMHIAFLHTDLPDRSRRLQIIAEIGMAADGPDAPALFCQLADRVASDKAGCAEDRDEVAHIGIPEALARNRGVLARPRAICSSQSSSPVLSGKRFGALAEPPLGAEPPQIGG